MSSRAEATQPRQLTSGLEVPLARVSPAIGASRDLHWGVAAAVVVASAAVVTLVAFWELGRASFWLDEATSYFAARLDWTDPAQAANVEGSLYMTLYFALLSGWRHLAGDSEVGLRSMSAVLSIATVPLVYWLAARLFDRRTGAVAVAVLALNGFLLQHAQEARSYALLVFLTTLASVAWVEANERPRQRAWWLVYAVVAGASLYAHIFAGYVVLAHGLATVAMPRWRQNWPKAAVVLGIVALLWAPLVATIATRGAGGLDWIPRPSLGLLGDYFGRLAGGPLMAFAALALAAIALVRAWQLERRAAGGGANDLFVVTLAITPILGSFAVSFVRPMFVDRYLIVAVVPIAIVMARAIMRLTGVPRPLVLASLLTLLAFSVAQYAMSNQTKEDWRAGAEHVLAAARPGDGVVFHAPYTRQALEYHLRETAPASLPRPVYPTTDWHEYHFGLTYGLPLDEALHHTEDLERVWIFLAHAHDADRDRLITWANERFGPAAEVRTLYPQIQLLLHSDAPVVSISPEQPERWEPGGMPTFAIVVSNIDSHGWPASGATLSLLLEPIDAPGGVPHEQRFEIGQLSPGDSERMSVRVRTPDAPGEYRISYSIVPEPGWVIPGPQGTIAVEALDAPWSERLAARYGADPPTSWGTGAALSYTVTLQNTGTVAWSAGGPNLVDLAVRFVRLSDGEGGPPIREQRFLLPHDVLPGDRVSVSVTPRAPALPGDYVLEHRLVRENIAWFESALTVDASVDDHTGTVVRIVALGALLALSGGAWMARVRGGGRRIARSSRP